MRRGSSSSLEQGITAYKGGQREAAVSAFSKAARENKADPLPHIYLARMAREVGDLQSTSPTLFQLGMHHTIVGDYPKALAYLEESLAVARNFGDQRMVAIAHAGMGTLARYQRDLATARTRYQASIRINQELGLRGSLQGWLTGLGCVEIMSGETAGPNVYGETSSGDCPAEAAAARSS